MNREQLDQAIRDHKAGAFDKAEHTYRALLRSEPRNSEVMFLLGKLAHQQGRHAQALQLFSEIIARDGRNAAAYNRRAMVHQTLGRFAPSLADLDQAIALKPRFPEALLNRGYALANMGRFGEAEASYRAAIAAAPAFAEAHYALGALLLREGRDREAIAALEAALRLKPQLAVALVDLSLAAARSGDADRCAEIAARVSAEAKAALPAGNAGMLHQCAIAQVNLGRFEDAFALLREAVARHGDSAKLHNALGAVRTSAGAPAAAIPHYRQALALRADHPGYAFNLAFALLATGNWREGWQHFEARLRGPRARQLSGPLFVPERRWCGEDLSGRSLLIYTDQGLGDAIQFARFVPEVARRARSVFLAVGPDLTAMLRLSMPASVEVIGTDDVPTCDLFVPLCSLPGALRLFESRLFMCDDYLAVNAEKDREWKRFFAAISPDAVPRVGFAWAGSPTHIADLKRTLPVQAMAPLFAVDGIRCYSLQVGPRAADLAAAGISNVAPLDDRLRDFSDTLAALANVDLLVTADTAVAHAAGAIGVSVINLVPYVADWRWGVAGETTPWYRSMRLFRQEAPGRWEPVIARVAAELRALAVSKAG
jgi:tetratricopeptide (TPR) repeat protein